MTLTIENMITIFGVIVTVVSIVLSNRHNRERIVREFEHRFTKLEVNMDYVKSHLGLDRRQQDKERS